MDRDLVPESVRDIAPPHDVSRSASQFSGHSFIRILFRCVRLNASMVDPIISNGFSERSVVPDEFSAVIRNNVVRYAHVLYKEVE